MNALFSILHRQKCKNTHHKLALDALRYLTPAPLPWANVFLWHIEPYLRGSKAPDTEFKDFTNHVLYPPSGGKPWGGAARLACKWYDKTLELLRSEDWAEAAYAAGVLGHYITDPLMPLHTAQSDAEALVHRSLEWAIARSYDHLLRPLPEQSDEKIVPVNASQAHWLADAITAESTLANALYWELVAEYDPERGDPDPIQGTSPRFQAISRKQLQRSQQLLGAILSCVIADAQVRPPNYPVTVAAVLAVPATPLFAVSRAVAIRRENKIVRAMSKERKAIGRLDHTQSADVSVVAESYEREVLTMPAHSAHVARNQVDVDPRTAFSEPRDLSRGALAAALQADAVTAQSPAASTNSNRSEMVVPPMPGTRRHSRRDEQPLRFRLALGDDVEQAPSIGPKTARKLGAAGIKTVSQLLTADPARVAAAAGGSVSAADAGEWQQQARLCCEVPGLAGHDAQLLVGCGVTAPADLVQFSPIELWELVIPVAESPDGRRILRDSKPPDLDEVTRWIAAAQSVSQAA